MRKMLNKKKSGFTLIELMIVVAILGILAALAIPAFVTYVKRSKTGEVNANLNSFFKSAATIYSKEFKDNTAGMPVAGGAVLPANSQCVAQENAAQNPGAPSASKQMFDPTQPGWAELGTNLADPVYYAYSFTATAAGTTVNMTPSVGPALVYNCGTAPSTANVYTFIANGNLDGDADESTFSMQVASDADNNLYHDTALTIDNELE